MADPRQNHILNASANLLGICFVVVTGLKLTHSDERTWADEICLLASIGFMTACVLSYISIRSRCHTRAIENVADIVFLASMLGLFVAVLAFARDFF